MKKSWAKDYLRIEITITISTMNEDEFDSSRKERNYIRYLISQVIFPRNRGGGREGNLCRVEEASHLRTLCLVLIFNFHGNRKQQGIRLLIAFVPPSSFPARGERSSASTIIYQPVYAFTSIKCYRR